ncbi:hypothetical protein CVT25_003530 [Psilocybe cyanescens]|uniref:Uncharacterized protein n=1 Tax=Psilocybe cyanescens TaxID=93625 RepID=A0A409WP06_PSICY|nr:hypothetical protein CVT25_003530 [Psilocybe cyanescens]
MAPPQETLRHLQKAWDLAHAAPFVEDRLTHDEARGLIKQMQNHLSNHLSQYDGAEFEESAFSHRVRRTLGQRIFLFVSARSSAFHLYNPYFLRGPFTPDNTIPWEVKDLASAAGVSVAPSIVPVVRPAQAIPPAAIHLDVSKRRPKGRGKARAPTRPSPSASSDIAADSRPSPRPQDLMEVIARDEASRSPVASTPVAGPAGARHSPSPIPIVVPALVDAPAKRKRGSDETARTQRGANSSSYDRKKSLALAALQANPGVPVLRGASPDNPPITRQELEGLGDHQSVFHFSLLWSVHSAFYPKIRLLVLIAGLANAAGLVSVRKQIRVHFVHHRSPKRGSIIAMLKWERSPSMVAVRVLCQDIQEARDLEAMAIDQATRLQLRTISLEFRLFETIQSIARNSSSEEGILSAFFDGQESLNRAVAGFPLFDIDENFKTGDLPSPKLSELLRAIPPHHLERFPQLFQYLREHGLLDEAGRLSEASPADHPMLDPEAEKATSGEASSEDSTESGSSDSEEGSSSGDEGSPENVRPTATKESSSSSSDDSSDESEGDRPPFKKVRLT